MKALTRRFWSLAAATSLLMISSACASKPAEDVQLSETPVPVESVETAGNANSDQPQQEVEDIEIEGALVDTFPEDVPLYDGTIISSTSSGPSEITGEPGWSVLITTDDSLETVDASIREAFSSNGWKIVTEMELGGGYQLIAREGGPTTSITYNDMTGPLIITYGVGG